MMTMDAVSYANGLLWRCLPVGSTRTRRQLAEVGPLYSNAEHATGLAASGVGRFAGAQAADAVKHHLRLVRPHQHRSLVTDFAGGVRRPRRGAGEHDFAFGPATANPLRQRETIVFAG